jgi:predicted ABC-type ATPase
MRIERSEDGDEDPSQKPEADVGRTADAGHLESKRSSESAEANVEQAEPRTRNEYADRVRPQDSDSPSDPLPADQTTTERDGPEDVGTKVEQPEDERSQTPPSGEHPGEPQTLEQREGEQPPSPDDSRDTDQAHGPDNPLGEPVGLEERNYNTTDDELGEEFTYSNEPGGPVEDKPQDSETRGNDVLERLEKAHEADLATDHENTTDPDNKQWTAERNRIHGEIVSDLYDGASAVPCEYKAIIAGGLPGAGKTTVLTEQAGIDLSKYLTINPDDIKEVLASRDLIPEVEGLSPMEASDLAHEESSVIAKYLAHRAQAEGKNIIWDITMSRLESIQERIESLRASGYEQIDAIFVDIPIEVSIRRTQARHREGQERWQEGDGMGGRFVPPEIIRKQADPEWGSKNKRNFEGIKQSINNWAVLDNGVDGRRARLVDSNDSRKTSPNPHEERPK